MVKREVVNSTERFRIAIDSLSEMLPVYLFTLRSADDDFEYDSINDPGLITAAFDWLSRAENSREIEISASWLINHHVDPLVQRGAKTLRSFLARTLMHFAKKGLSLQDYASTFRREHKAYITNKKQ